MKRAFAWSWVFLALASVPASVVACRAGAVEAPFGFFWSQDRDTLPDPSSVLADENMSVLVYQDTGLPPGMRDTDSVSLIVCENFGLQQVRWVSRIFSLSAGVKRFITIYEAGVARYGEADQGNLDNGVAAWTAHHVGMRLDRAGKDGFRIVMVADGPQLAQCQVEHGRVVRQP